MGRIHTSVEGLDTRLKAIGTGLEGNRDTLAGNATSLGQLGDSVEAMATRLDSGVIEDSLGDIQKVIVVVLLVFTAWSLVPGGRGAGRRLVAAARTRGGAEARSTRRPDRGQAGRSTLLVGSSTPVTWIDMSLPPMPVDSQATR